MSLVRPIITYCIEIWAGAYPTCLKQLKITMYNHIKFILNISYNAHQKISFIKPSVFQFDVGKLLIGFFSLMSVLFNNFV